ncbi:Alpha/beta hydrolase fold-1 [Mycena albidolilacea]|uniref:Alpha/beta hydrolase fold-1 n=1 Tax=Mycena albidolilacea TaxID=1033008 RepID=A0AAD7ENX0_9AGAR|nr:Alpha/beta hydrolase fold-1 [Mycena albidolilacea]
MYTATKPAIVIIPASFSPLSLYSAVIADLESHGYSVHGVELQTVGRREKAPSMYDDAAAVASVASKLAEEGKDVVLVAHSYGGLVACEASKGLAKSVREKEGKQGGIARIVFVAAVVPSEGQSLMDAMVDVKMDSHHLKDEYLVMDVAGAAEVSYSDMPPDEALSWASRMREHAVGSFQQKLTYAAYKDIPVSYLLCEEDRGVVPELQNKLIAGMESVMGGTSVDRHPVKSGHHINASQPATMSAVIRKAVGDTA